MSDRHAVCMVSGCVAPSPWLTRTTYAPINVKPQGGGGGADPGKFDIFTRARVKFPTPGHLENVKFPPLGTAFCPKQVGRSCVKFPTPGQNLNFKIPAQGKAHRVNFPWVACPPPWGLTLIGALMQTYVYFNQSFFSFLFNILFSHDSFCLPLFYCIVNY